MEQNNSGPEITVKKSWTKQVLRSGVNVVILVAVFWVGISIGNGTISFTTPTKSNKSLPSTLDTSEAHNVYNLLRKNFDGDLDAQKLQDGMKSGLVKAAGDPYTEYFNAKDAKEFNEQLSGSFSGIGAQLGKDDKDNIIVIAPIANYPAEKAGLRAKDVVTEVDGKSTAGLSIDETVGKIRGKKGTQVTLKVVRDSKEQKELTITREDIKIPSVEYKILPENIGYIQISQFWDDTYGLTSKAAKEFKKAGVKGVIVDLRSNPGGSLDAAVDISNIWLPNGKTILQEKRDGRVVQTYTSSGTPVLLDVPTIVLVNEGSASASEIVAGALRDNKAATLVGVKSYGKGSVQQIIPLGNGGELKVTVARWFRPNGQNIDKKGINPDTEIKMTDEDYAGGKDPQKDAAINQLNK
jgi:carboxyl-terminal processing protease